MLMVLSSKLLGNSWTCVTTSVARMTHVKSRSKFYPRTEEQVARLHVPDEKVNWEVPWPEYAPPFYTAAHISEQPWADPPLGAQGFCPKWNVLDGSVDRASHHGEYPVVDGTPLNVRGRTGLAGRGLLGRWGPNHAADPIVTRWKTDARGGPVVNDVSRRRVLQFVGVQRRDTGEWALPGGMVDPGEHVSATLVREFSEEALDGAAPQVAEAVRQFFLAGRVVYKGYVDDHRSTDNAWIETVAANFHDEDSSCVGALPLRAGSDAMNVRWMDVDRTLALYASHADLLCRVAQLHDSHW